MMILGCSKQIGKRFRMVAKEVIAGTSLSHAGRLLLTNMEQAKIRQVLFAPIAVRKKFVKHLLLRLNVEVLDQNIAPYFPNEATIEHVLPQRPRTGSYWHSAFPEAKVRKYFCGLLGNYALLTASLNAKAKNEEFLTKRKAIFAMSSVNMFPLTANLATFDTWTKDDISRRQGDMLTLLSSILGISLPWSDSQNLAAE
jgi:hypothetical protein